MWISTASRPWLRLEFSSEIPCPACGAPPGVKIGSDSLSPAEGRRPFATSELRRIFELSPGRWQRDIIDEPGLAEECGGAETAVGDLGIIDAEAVSGEGLAGCGGGAGASEEGGSGEGAVEERGAGALGGAEVSVAGTHGEAVGLADGARDDEVDGEVEVADHAADDVALLGVLLAEHGDVGEDEVEEFCDHGGHAAEVAGARGAAAARGKMGFLDPGGVVAGVEGAGGEQDIGAEAAAGGGILGECAGIGGEVLARPELGGVHVGGDDDDVREAAGAADQFEVALVEGAHRRDQADAHALPLASEGE